MNETASFRAAMARVVGLVAGPYGYTVSLWSAGAIVSARYGSPGFLDILLFAGGAVIAYGSLMLWSLPRISSEVPRPVPRRIAYNAVPLVSISAALLATLSPWRDLGFATAGFAATGSYLLGVSFLLRTPGLTD
jgi:hypothetical protein